MSGNSKQTKPAAPAPRYRIGGKGLAWDGHTAAPDTIRDDIPAESVPWLIKGGYISAIADDTPAPVVAPAEEGADHGGD